MLLQVCLPKKAAKSKREAVDRLAKLLRQEFPEMNWEIHADADGDEDETGEPDEAHAYGP